MVAAGVEMRDIMRDGNGGRRRQKGEQRHQAAQCAVGVSIVPRCLQVPSQDALEGKVAQAGRETDHGKDDAALQKFMFVHARVVMVFCGDGVKLGLPEKQGQF